LRSCLQPHRGRRRLALDPQRRLRPRRIVAREQLAELGVPDAAGQPRRAAREDQADPGGGRDQTGRVRQAAGGARAGGAQAEDDGGGGAAIGDDDGDRERGGDRRRARVILRFYHRRQDEGDTEGRDHHVDDRRTTDHYRLTAFPSRPPRPRNPIRTDRRRPSRFADELLTLGCTRDGSPKYSDIHGIYVYEEWVHPKVNFGGREI